MEEVLKPISEKYCHGECPYGGLAALVGFETLRALKQACDELSLTKSEVEDIFWNNAVTLFGARVAEFAAEHPAPLAVPAPNFKTPVDFMNNCVVDRTYGTLPKDKGKQKL